MASHSAVASANKRTNASKQVSSRGTYDPVCRSRSSFTPIVRIDNRPGPDAPKSRSCRREAGVASIPSPRRRYCVARSFRTCTQPPRTRGRQHASEHCAASAVRRGVHTSRLERRSLASAEGSPDFDFNFHRAETYARRDEQCERQRARRVRGLRRARVVVGIRAALCTPLRERGALCTAAQRVGQKPRKARRSEPKVKEFPKRYRKRRLMTTTAKAEYEISDVLLREYDSVKRDRL